MNFESQSPSTGSSSRSPQSSRIRMKSRYWAQGWIGLSSINFLLGLSLWSTLSLILLPSSVSSVELTFELPDNAKDCFYENIEKGKQSTFEYQVVTGGQYDVDVSIEAHNKQVIYKEIKKQYDTFVWIPDMTGVFTFCFSNEFSTFSHKLVYMDLQVGDESPLPGIGEHVTAMTQVWEITKYAYATRDVCDPGYIVGRITLGRIGLVKEG